MGLAGSPHNFPGAALPAPLLLGGCLSGPHATRDCLRLPSTRRRCWLPLWTCLCLCALLGGGSLPPPACCSVPALPGMWRSMASARLSLSVSPPSSKNVRGRVRL